MQRPLITAGPCVLTALSALITPGTTKLVGFRVKHRVQRLFERATHHLAKVIPDPRFVDPDHLTHTCVLLFIHLVAPSITVEKAVNPESAKDSLRYRIEAPTTE